MTKEGDQNARKEGSGRSERAPVYKKERASKEDGRYIIFYTFGDGEAGETRPDKEESD